MLPGDGEWVSDVDRYPGSDGGQHWAEMGTGKTLKVLEMELLIIFSSVHGR